MPLGAARITLLAKTQVVAEAEVIRRKVGVTAVGNAQVDTSESKFGGASALFDGTGDALYARVGDTPYVDIGTGDVTFECWIRKDTTATKSLFDARVSTNTNVPLVQAGTNVQMWWNNSFVITHSTTLSTNTWYHVALVRESGDWTIYVDGVASSSYTGTDALPSNTEVFRIGINQPGSNSHDGYLDEFRISNIARYTSGFTAPTTPFTNDENTLLLLHMDGTDGDTVFNDDNGHNRTQANPYAVGIATLDTSQKKFGVSSVHVGEQNDDGDYIAIDKDHPVIDEILQWGLTTGFTFEYWIRHTSFTTVDNNGYSTVFGLHQPTDFPYTVNMGTDRNGDLLFNFRDTSNNQHRYSSSSTPLSTNTWHHCAFVKNGSNLSMYVDGTSVSSNTITATPNSTTNRPAVFGSFYRNGALAYMDEFRISKVARYTSNFTAPTAPFVNDDDTVLLLHMDGTDGTTYIQDDNGVRAQIGIKAEGNAQVDTAQSKFGGGSALFDGSGDYLETTQENIMNLGTDDFTLECWFYPTTVNSQFRRILTTSVGGLGADVVMRLTNQNKIQSYVGNTNVGTGTTTITANNWYHLAMVRNSSGYKVYLNGVEEISQGSSASIDRDILVIGGYYSVTSSEYFIGNIEEVRLSNNARYTEAFTPPTEAFVNDDNTILLLHMDGTDGSTTFIDDNGVPANYDWGS